MAIDTQSALSYYERINTIKQYIHEHMDEPLNRELLAELAGFSVPHFHRIFTAHVGENISAYVRRVRMERAARQLLANEVNITEIAFNSGYETHSAFGKAFKQSFGVTPTEFRELNPKVAAHMIDKRILYRRKETAMQPQEIRTLPDTKVLYARASEVMTSYAFQTANGEAFRKLHGYMDAHQLMGKARQFIAIYPDDPEIGKEVRFDAGAILEEGVEPPVSDGMGYQTLRGGRWAIFRHIGPYENLWQTWQGIYRDWLPTSGYELRDAIPFEDYVDDPSKVEREKLRTDIYIPIQ
jgi:AraC family transcriptional regulator